METRTLPGLSKYLFREDGEVISLWPHALNKVLVGGTDKDGYRKFVLIGDMGERRYVRRASLICAAFHGPKPNGMNVRHLDGSRTNDAADNLLWGTQQQNIADKITHGTAQVGRKHPMAKLTEEQVRFVRDDTAPGNVLAAQLGVSKSAISSIRSGRSWKSLT